MYLLANASLPKQVHRSHDVEEIGQILCNLDPKIKVKERKTGIWDGVPSTAV